MKMQNNLDGARASCPPSSLRHRSLADWKSALLLTSILLVTFLPVLLLGCKSKAAQCPLCEREIHHHMQVSMTHDSIPMKTCCMSCALTYKAQAKNVEIKAATDFLTDAPLDPKKAFYVVASDISPCTQDVKVQKYVREPHAALHACYDRCEPGILAFDKKSDAQEFQQEHGGRLQKFDQLINWLPVKGGQSHD